MHVVHGPTLREKNSFCQTTFSSVRLHGSAHRVDAHFVNTIATFACCPTARSIQSLCGDVIPWYSSPIDLARNPCTSSIAVHVTATKTTATNAGKIAAYARGTKRKSSAATVAAANAHTQTRSSAIVWSCSRHQIDSASSSEEAGTPISVLNGRSAGRTAAAAAASQAHARRGTPASIHASSAIRNSGAR